MTEPRTDSFQDFWDHGFNHNETNRKLNCLQTWNMSRKQAEEKIEELREDNKELKREIIIGINLHAEELERSVNLKKKIEILTKELSDLRGRYDTLSSAHSCKIIENIKLKKEIAGLRTNADKKIEILTKALEDINSCLSGGIKDYHISGLIGKALIIEVQEKGKL